MDEGDDHQMSARVGIAVEDHKRPLAAIRDEILRAVCHRLRNAKHTAFCFVVIFDVFHTPRGPEVIHVVELHERFETRLLKMAIESERFLDPFFAHDNE